MNNNFDFLHMKDDTEEESSIPYCMTLPSKRAGATATVAEHSGKNPAPTNNQTPGAAPGTSQPSTNGSEEVFYHPKHGEMKISPNFFIQGHAPPSGSFAALKGQFKVPPLPPIPPSNGEEQRDGPIIGPRVDANLLAHAERFQKEVEEAAASLAPDPIENRTAGNPKSVEHPKKVVCSVPEAEPREDGTNKSVNGSDSSALKKLMELSKRFKKGDGDAARELFQLLDQCPELWQQVGDLSSIAERALGDAIYGSNLAMAETLKRHRDNLKLQLLGDSPNLLVKMTVQRVVASFSFSQLVDMKCAEIAGQGGRIGDWGRMKVQAERQLQIALKSLELVRKSDVLAPPKSQSLNSGSDKKIAAKTSAKKPTRRKKASSKKAVVKMPKTDTPCCEEVACGSTTERFRSGESLTVNGADRLAPYQQHSSPNGRHSNGDVRGLADAVT